MRNEKLDEFLHRNRLKSSDLVEFWGVTKGVVSQILNGTTKLPTKRLEELLNNPHGWDVSMLTETQSRDEMIENKPVEDIAMMDRFLNIIEDQKRDIQMLLEMLRDKDNEIKRLREELDERKRGVAQNAGCSSVADVI